MRRPSVFVLGACAASVGCSQAAPMNISHLRCENVSNPMGIEERSPRLTWRLASPTRGDKQTSYQILVASSHELLSKNKGDLWDSGRVRSGDTGPIAYKGKALSSGARAFWKVRVWDATGQKSTVSAPASWSMGLLSKSDWHGQWIGFEAPRVESEADARPTLERASWVWFPEATGNPISAAPVGARWFRKSFTVPEGRAISSALIRVAVDNKATIFVNGKEVGRSKDSWRTRESFDVKSLLKPGANVIAVAAVNDSDTADKGPNPAGLLAEMNVRFATGEPLTILSDASWKSSDTEPQNWNSTGFDDSGWKSSQVLAKAGGGPWGAIASTTLITGPPAPHLRREFSLSGKVKRATAYVCGLGYYEMSLNGQKVSDHVLDPGWTRYDKRSLYVAHDVTKYLKDGENALGVILGTGHFDDHVLSVWDFDRASWRARPKMLLEMRVEFEDGRTQTITSDKSWKASTGPILFDSIAGGEHYDARREIASWNQPSFSDAAWKSAEVVTPVQGKLVAQVAPPIKVTQVLKPVKVTQPKPGVWIFDLGQNFAGVPQLRVSGPAGTKVAMRCAEKLHADGTLDAANIDEFVKRRDKDQRFQTDIYTLKGGGRETWSPRFTYHGFQYVEVIGFPGTPTVDNLRGLVMHSAFETAGTFESSSALLNKIQQNTLWSYRNNFHSIPTDCPQREKNGWTGDAHLAAELGLLNFDSTANYEKWLDDITDVQKENGELPGIVPTSGWGYNIGPAWDSAYPLITWYLYEHNDDKSVIARHYANLDRYMAYVATRAKDGIVDYGLGDWLPAKTKTPSDITSTAYYFKDARLMAKMAALIGKPNDAKRYDALAESIKKAFNAKFVNTETGKVGNGSLTSQSTPLYQGLLDEKDVPKVFEALVAEVKNQDYHMDVGILGAKYLLNVLADNGRADIVGRMLQKTTFPSYGNWIERGATTLWEEWNGNQSRNHVMFGDVSAWFHKYLAGIQMAKPGFKSLALRPHVVGGVTSARGTHDSARGRIESAWRLDAGKFTWTVIVPPGVDATVFVPCARGDQAKITEGGQAIAKAKGVKLLKQEDDGATYTVQSGTYRFACPMKAGS